MKDHEEQMTEAKRLIDEALADIKNQNFVETGAMTDLLLDLRLLLITESETTDA